MRFIFMDARHVKDIKEKIQGAQGTWGTVRYELMQKAEEWMGKGPWSVTFSPSPAASGDPHDYYSEGPYWWPDPQNPGGPFIRRDGEFYPGAFMHHKKALQDMCDALVFLCSAGYYLDEKKFLERAAEIVRVWFMDADTRMNPHLEYSQAIRGICEGRGIGIIDLVKMVRAVHALTLMRQYPDYQKEIEGVSVWLSEMLHWLTTSKKGLDESREKNNHGTWWHAQVAAYSAFVQDEILLHRMFDAVRNHFIPIQMEEDGSFPRELARTKSMQYSIFNLDALAVLCEIAHYAGVDLWHDKTSGNKEMKLAVEYILPYINNPFLWKYQEISGEVPDTTYILQTAAIRLHIPECREVNRKRGTDRYLVRMNNPIGPLVLLPGSALTL